MCRILELIPLGMVLLLSGCGPYTIDLDPGYGPGLCTVSVTDVSTRGGHYLVMSDLKPVTLEPVPPVSDAVRADLCTRLRLAENLGGRNFISVRITHIELSAETTPKRIYHGNMSGVLEIRSLEKNTRKSAPLFVSDTLDQWLTPHPAEGAEKLMRNMIPKLGLHIENIVERFCTEEPLPEDRRPTPSASRVD